MDTSKHTVIIHISRHFIFQFLKWFFVCLGLGLIVTLFIVMKPLLFTCGISIIFISITIVIALGITLFLPSITAEVQSITVNLQLKHPAVLTDEFKTIIEEKFPLMKQRGLSEDIASYLHSTLDTLIEKSIEILFEFVHIVSMIFTVPIFTFFLLKDGQRIKQSLIQFVPNCYFEMTLSLVYKISHQIGSYIRGRLLDAMIVGILCTITLYLLDVRYAFLIGLLAGCANIIPHFGPIVGAIPAIIVALMETGSFTSVLVITISFVAIQLFDHLFISHMIELKNIHMHSIVVLIVIFIGGYLMGALGMFIVLFLV